HRLKGKHSISAILDSLKKASCSHIQENYYLFDHYDEVLSGIKKELGIDLGQKCLSLGEIKKL
ncbi:transposase, partial [Lederbergia sp. NSJ-179]|nr:transposase [Lederbergia sp. NSJ-179]